MVVVETAAMNRLGPTSNCGAESEELRTLMHRMINDAWRPDGSPTRGESRRALAGAGQAAAGGYRKDGGLGFRCLRQAPLRGENRGWLRG